MSLMFSGKHGGWGREQTQMSLMLSCKHNGERGGSG